MNPAGSAAPLPAAPSPPTARSGFGLPSVPLSAWMLVLALAIGLAAGFDSGRLVAIANQGFGRALGEFALLLLPSFVLSFALVQRRIGGAETFARSVSPLVGAAMVCPDTAYAALAPVAGRRKVETALGAYAGFKLLFPAGPLIVATGFGVAADLGLYLWSAVFLALVWGVGLIWAHRLAPAEAGALAPDGATDWGALLPFALLAGLLGIGALVPLPGWPVLDFLTTPKGALLAAAAFAVLRVDRDARSDVVQSSVRRTALLLFTIGTASAFGAMLLAVVPLARDWPSSIGPVGAAATLFAGAALFKLIQGSSMATFAAVTAVGAPVIAASGLGPAAAVLAVCLGTLVAITPNDSFYWLVRTDAFEGRSETASLRVLTLGSVLQGLAGLGLLLVLVGAGAL